MTEEDVYNEQEQLIKEAYGAEQAGAANYGQGVDEYEDGTLIIDTKVYTDPVTRLVSTLYPDGTCKHNWS